VSPDGKKVYFANWDACTVDVINTSINAVTDTILVGCNSGGVSVSPNSSIVYVANQGAPGTVNVINAATNIVSATIIGFSSPWGISVSPDGSKVYVADDSVKVISTSTNAVIATIPVSAPLGISVSPNGSKVYVTNDNSNTVSVINTATNTVTETITGFSSPYSIAVSPDGSKVYVENQSSNTVSVIDTATNTISATITGFNGPWGLSVSPDGSKLYVVNHGNNTVSVVNTANNTITATIPVGSDPVAFGNFISIHTSVGIEPQSILSSCVEVYPNPVIDNLQIQTTLPIKEIAITDITGRLLYTTTAKTINCSSFAKGVYFIKATTSEGAIVKKFIKE
jgi:YVTN family beta-propeller protein